MKGGIVMNEKIGYAAQRETTFTEKEIFNKMSQLLTKEEGDSLAMAMEEIYRERKLA